MHAQLRDKKQALDCLEEAHAGHSPGLYRLKVEPLLDPLRDEPRFKDLLRRLNFPQ
ncbi:MAG: TPR end-of-group domain-containing protein [Planctomycetota bacterium]